MRTGKVMILIAVLALVLTPVLASASVVETAVAKGKPVVVEPQSCPLAENPTPLYAGQDIWVGNVAISNNGHELTVVYSTNGTEMPPYEGWYLRETHLYVGVEPPAKNAPGQFPFAYDEFGYWETEYTYKIDLNEIEGFEEGECVYVAAHAVVETVVDYEQGLDDFAAALPEQVTISVAHPGTGFGTPSYFDTTISGGTILDGTYDGFCIDTDNTINPGGTYTATVYSSYEAGAQSLVEYPENLDLVNWIINEGFVGQMSGCDGANYTYGDVQKAIWTLIEDDYSSTAGLGPWTQCKVDEIVAAAYAVGEGFEPDCNQLVAVVLQPVNGAQATIAQVTFSAVDVPCEPIFGDETAWGFGDCDFGRSWGTYFQYCPTFGPTVTPGYSNLTEAAGVRYRGNSSGNEIYLGIPDLGVGGNRVEASYPNVYTNWQDGTYAVTFSYDPIDNKIVTTIDGPGGTESLEYDFDDRLSPGCPVANWNTMDINVVDRLTTGELAYNNVMLGGYSLGDFDDEGWKNWTVSGFDFSQGFTISGDMVVQGWTGSETNKLQLVVGCLP